MSPHLSPTDVVDALDGALAGTLAEHLASCPVCRRSVAEMRRVMGALDDPAATEPPPAFWNELDARIRTATRALESPNTSSARRTWIALGGLAAAVVLAVIWAWAQDRELGGTATTGHTATAPSWESMVELAATMTADDIERVTAVRRVQPLADLTDEERRAFVELLDLEMGDRR